MKITSDMDPRLNQAGPTLIVLADHKPPVYDAAGITLITSSVRRPPLPDSLDPKIHHNNLLPSILARIEATAAGADDALMLDHRGFVAETKATNIFLVADGMLGTPSAAACPEGITTAAVLELGPRLASAAWSVITAWPSSMPPTSCSSPGRWAGLPPSSGWMADHRRRRSWPGHAPAQ